MQYFSLVSLKVTLKDFNSRKHFYRVKDYAYFVFCVRGERRGTDSLSKSKRVGVGTSKWFERGLNFSQVSTMRKRTVNKPDDA